MLLPPYFTVFTFFLVFKISFVRKDKQFLFSGGTKTGAFPVKNRGIFRFYRKILLTSASRFMA